MSKYSVEYIEKQAAIDAIRKAENHAFNSFYKGLVKAHKIVADLPSVDVVSVSAYKQVMWERDVAVEQLKQIGKGLGEAMDDATLIAHGWGQK